MKRSTRKVLAQETLAIIERGAYTPGEGRSVSINAAVRDCEQATRLYSPDDLRRMRDDILTAPAGNSTAKIEVVNETTLAGVARLLQESDAPVAALNFASAKNPGGGFLNGSQAQEESLARSSALHASLLQAWEFYETHRALSSLLYTDAMILSPNCPVFRNDAGDLLPEPQAVTFITSAAPNAGAAADNRPDELSDIPEVFRRRSEYVLALAHASGCRRLILGAWGCGVFRNDPAVVASAFAHHLRGEWGGRFDHVTFSVLDTSESQATFETFRSAFDAGG